MTPHWIGSIVQIFIVSKTQNVQQKQLPERKDTFMVKIFV